jgi:hypothetical protein
MAFAVDKSVNPDWQDEDLEAVDDSVEREDRRKAKRRHLIDRRMIERRRKYWWSVIFPIIVGVCVTALISWGAYVTHVTYRISANYEMSFVRHIEDRAKKDLAFDHKIEMLRSDYTVKLGNLRTDLNKGLTEIRETNLKIYELLLQQGKKDLETQ